MAVKLTMESIAALIRVDFYKQSRTSSNPVERDSGLDSSRSFLQQEESVVRKGILLSA